MRSDGMEVQKKKGCVSNASRELWAFTSTQLNSATTPLSLSISFFPTPKTPLINQETPLFYLTQRPRRQRPQIAASAALAPLAPPRRQKRNRRASSAIMVPAAPPQRNQRNHGAASSVAAPAAQTQRRRQCTFRATEFTLDRQKTKVSSFYRCHPLRGLESIMGRFPRANAAWLYAVARYAGWGGFPSIVGSW